MSRKSPHRHSVRSHSRSGYSVDKYERGQGKAPILPGKSSHNIKVSGLMDNRGNFTSSKRMKILQVRVKSRREWIERMFMWGHKGRVDFNINAKNKNLAKNPWDYSRWSGDPKQPQSDLIDRYGLDRSRKDVSKFKSKAGNNVYVGSGSDVKRRKLAFNARRILHNQFTIQEIRGMGAVFLEASSPTGGKAIGRCTHYPAYNGNYVMIKGTVLDADKVITHELVHASRFGMKDSVRDRNREEKETDLETTCRIPLRAITDQPTYGGGYYQFIPTITRSDYWKKQAHFDSAIRRAMLNDRKIILGTNRKMRGKILRQRINERYHQTEISKAHFSPAELLDRYFSVKDEGIAREIHIRYDKPTTLAEIKKEFIKEYGSDVEVYEHRDGKKVKIISPSKKKAKIPNLDGEERTYLGWILDEGKRIDVPGVCIEHPGLLRLKKKGLIYTNQPIKQKHIITWRLTDEGKKIAQSLSKIQGYSLPRITKPSDKKQLKIDEINEIIQRSEYAKGEGVKAELRKDGSILYTKLFQASHGKYKGKISFNGVLSYLDGKDARYLIRKYGKGKHARRLRAQKPF